MWSDDRIEQELDDLHPMVIWGSDQDYFWRKDVERLIKKLRDEVEAAAQAEVEAE